MEKRMVKMWNKKIIDAIVDVRLTMYGQDKAGDYWYAVHTKTGGTSAMYRLSSSDNLIDINKDRISCNDTSIQRVLESAQYGKATQHAWDAIALRVTSKGELVQLNHGDERSYIDIAIFKEVFGDWRKYTFSGTKPMQPIFVADDAGETVGVICPCRCREEEEKK